MTLTYRTDVSTRAAVVGFNRFVSRVERLCSTPPQWIRVVAAQQRGTPHVHALMHGTDGVEPMAMVSWWQVRGLGWARVLRVYDVAGAARYLADHIVREGDLGFSDGLRAPGALP